MKRVYHLSYVAHILYTLAVTMVLSGVTMFVLTVLSIELTDLIVLTMVGVYIIGSIIYFYFYIMILTEEEVVISQFPFHRKIVRYEDFTKLMFMYYHPNKKRYGTNYGQRGYK